MERRFQFSTRNALWATCLAALSLTLVTTIPRVNPEPWMMYLATFVLMVVPAAAVGALGGRTLLGALCGVASFLAIWGWNFFGAD
jgi:hypothetical protein